MHRDFTVASYKALLNCLIEQGYQFQTFAEFLNNPLPKVVVLRHDVDAKPKNSLRFAKIQGELGVKGVYYFRAVPQSWDEAVIREIGALGHEVGYHYECLTTCNGDMSKAMADFEKNLGRLRKLAPVSTICMHGSPMSKYDSKDLWLDHNYQDFGIIGEPYFDVDFNQVFYLTDTGRRWNGDKVSVRDKVESGFDLSFKWTNDIIAHALNHGLPNQIMFTFHPQRWNDDPMNWTIELFFQNMKNLLKKFFFVR